MKVARLNYMLEVTVNKYLQSIFELLNISSCDIQYGESRGKTIIFTKSSIQKNQVELEHFHLSCFFFLVFLYCVSKAVLVRNTMDGIIS